LLHPVCTPWFRLCFIICYSWCGWTP